MRAVRPSTPKRIFRVAALLAMLACVGPVGSAAAFSKAIWGDVYRNGKSQFPLYHKLGVSIFELGVNWSQVAPTRPAHPADPKDPAYAWPAEVDQAIAQARRYHIRILVQLNNAPRWASGHANPSYAPRHPADFATFAAAAARRWPGVHLWMIWGEPIRTFLPIVPARHGARLNNAQKRAPHRYALLVDKTYRALKAVSRRNLIIAGDSYSTSKLDPYQWISNLRLPNGRAPRMDMYGHNPFTGPQLLRPAVTRTRRRLLRSPSARRLGRSLPPARHAAVPVRVDGDNGPRPRDVDLGRSAGCRALGARCAAVVPALVAYLRPRLDPRLRRSADEQRRTADRQGETEADLLGVPSRMTARSCSITSSRI
jgi:hypothetical protein